MVQAAVPGVAATAAVPAEIGSGLPGPESLADHNVVNVSTADVASNATLCCIKSVVYGAVGENCLKIIVAAPPADNA
mgnify:CR=1 FL=1